MRVAWIAFASVVVAAGALIALVQWRWRETTAALVDRLRQPIATRGRAPFSPADLAGLPSPVTRFFLAVLRPGQPMIARACIEQQGAFLVKPGQEWRRFTAVEHFAAAPAGFVWDARIFLAPGAAVLVRDGFVDGAGFMRAILLGLLPIVRRQGTPAIAAGALVRYLAEAVWLPTALLPSPQLTWSPLDDRSARATLTVGTTTVSLDFHFGPDGLVERVYTDARGREVGGRVVPTPWEGRWTEWTEHDGVRIPAAGEVAWLLPEGPMPYWRGRVVSARFEPEATASRVAGT